MIPAGEFYDMLLDRLGREKEQKLQDTGIGKARSWADYNRRAGVCKGLQQAQDIAAALWAELQGQED